MLYLCTKINLDMEKMVVKIPHIAEELRIGYSFNYQAGQHPEWFIAELSYQ